MILTIANPIYDTVFKYIMDDERIARTILSALLRRNVVGVRMRPHEHINDTNDKHISLFRIDFSATVRETDGSESHVLVELQKTWVETETLRFRRYLGAQYNNKNNMQGEGRDAHALPTVAVYLLGHRVGDIEEPVIYCSHTTTDYNGVPVVKGMPDPFVESLVHDSIIVQLPLLRGRVNNRLEQVLSIFDQSRADNADSQLLHVDELAYDGDKEMEYILRRLTAAASNAQMREDMNMEDELLSILEKRDTELLRKNELINKQKEQLAAMVRMLHDSGLGTEQIAAATGMDVAEVTSMFLQD